MENMKMKMIKLLALCVMVLAVSACKPKSFDCADQSYQAAVIELVNDNLCDKCVTELTAIRKTGIDPDTGLVTCQANMKFTNGSFHGERAVYYKIEKLSTGEPFVSIYGVPKFFHVTGR